MSYLVFLVPASFLVLLGIIHGGSPEGRLRIAAAASRWPLIAMFASLLAMSLAMFLFLRIRRQPRLVAICLTLSSLLHLVFLLAFGGVTIQRTSISIPLPEKRHQLASGLSALTESMVGQEVREKPVELPDQEARRIAEAKVPRRDAPEPVKPRTAAELHETAREAPTHLISDIDPASKPKNVIDAELQDKSQPRKDDPAAKLVVMKSLAAKEPAKAPEEPRDTKRLELTQAALSPLKLEESARKLKPDQGDTMRREPARPQPPGVPAAAPSMKPDIEEELASKLKVTPVDRIRVPAAQAARPEPAADSKLSPGPRAMESEHRPMALAEKTAQPGPAPQKPSELPQAPALSLVRTELSAQAARRLDPAERTTAAAAQRSGAVEPLKLQDTVQAIKGQAPAPARPDIAFAQPRQISQGRRQTADRAPDRAGEKPHAEISTKVEEPSETVADIIAEATARLNALEPQVEERMDSRAGKPMPLTQAVNMKAATLPGGSGDDSRQPMQTQPAAIATARARTGVADGDAASLAARPSARTGRSGRSSGSRKADQSLVAKEMLQDRDGPRAPLLRDASLRGKSAATAAGAEGLPDMAPGMALVKKSSGAAAAARQVTDRREFLEARAQSGTFESGATAARPSPELRMEVTNALLTMMGDAAGGSPDSPSAETSLPIAESLRGTAASATAGREMVRFGIAAAGLREGDARSGSVPNSTSLSPRSLDATKVGANPGAEEFLSEPSSPALAALARGTGAAGSRPDTLVQSDSGLRTPAGGQARAVEDGLLRSGGGYADSRPVAMVGGVSSIQAGSGDLRGSAGSGGGQGPAAGMQDGRGALAPRKVSSAGDMESGAISRPAFSARTGTASSDRSLAGRAVPYGSGDVAAGVAESLAPVAAEGRLSAGDVGLTSAGIGAQAATAVAAAPRAGAGTLAGVPATVTLGRAGGGSLAPEQTGRLSAPQWASSAGGAAQPAGRLVDDAGGTASAAAGPALESVDTAPASRRGAREIEAASVVFSMPKAAPSGGSGPEASGSPRAPVDGVGLMAASKSAGGMPGGAPADAVRREAPAGGGSVDRAPARLEMSFDLDSAASGHVRAAGLAEADRQQSSHGSRHAALSVGTAPNPESVPEKAIYQMRKPEKRKEFIVELGGTPETENAVEHGLAWLARAQSDDGRWNLREFKSLRECGGAGDLATEDAAMTGLVLLSFLGAGYTHTGGAYKDSVRKGLEWILSGQTPQGDLRRGGTMYGQAITAAALCESYSLTGDERLIEPCRLAIAFILKAQNPEAAWRYEPRDDNDTSVTGWQILALKSAQIAGLKIPQEHFKWTGMWLDKVRKGAEGGLYCYKAGHPETPVMTAEGWFCQLFMSGQAQARGQAESIRFLMNNLPAWTPENRAVHLYYWYYGTLSMYLSGANEFKAWNAALRDALLKGQVRKGPAAGSWDPVDQLGPRGGRIYTTAAATLCLEVYYRFMPIYKMPKPPGGPASQ